MTDVRKMLEELVESLIKLSEKAYAEANNEKNDFETRIRSKNNEIEILTELDRCRFALNRVIDAENEMAKKYLKGV